MANNYTLYSARLALHNQLQLSWAMKFFKLVNDATDSDYKAPKKIPDDEKIFYTHLKRLQRDNPSVFEFGSFSFEKANTNDEPYTIVLISEEYDNLDLVLLAVQNVYKQFSLDDIFEVTWANTCSAMRVDQFGGGCAAVCRYGQRVTGSHTILKQHVQDLKKLIKTSKNAKKS